MCTKVLNEDDIQQKKTSKYLKWNLSATNGQILAKFETLALVTKPKFTDTSNEDDIQWKMTSKY